LRLNKTGKKWPVVKTSMYKTGMKVKKKRRDKYLSFPRKRIKNRKPMAMVVRRKAAAAGE
jgi:hypothetical protein